MKITQPFRALPSLALAVIGLSLVPPATHAALLLNDTFADGDRSNTNLPTDSPVWIGMPSGVGGSFAVTPGHLNFTLPTTSLKFWTYFTSDNSAPDANQPHNAVTTLGANDTLTASTTFSISGVGSSTSKTFRMGLFFDPSDPRVQSDANSDGGGSTAPWTDALGYFVQIPLSTSTTNTPIQIGKRTTSNTSLIGSGSAYTLAPTGGTGYSLSNTPTTYTLSMTLSELTATDMQVAVTLLNDTTSTVVATQTVHDLGSTFGGTSVSGALTGNSSIYTNFDQLMFRNDNNEATSLDFTNFAVSTGTVPEPSSLAACALATLPALARRRRTRSSV
jgi:hypothetical protein